MQQTLDQHPHAQEPGRLAASCRQRRLRRSILRPLRAGAFLPAQVVYRSARPAAAAGAFVASRASAAPVAFLPFNHSWRNHHAHDHHHRPVEEGRHRQLRQSSAQRATSRSRPTTTSWNTTWTAFSSSVKNAFVAARQAVQDELARELNATGQHAARTNDHAAEPSPTAANGNGNGAGNNHANGNGSQRQRLRPTATATATAAQRPRRVREATWLCPAARQVDPGPGRPPAGNPGPEDVRQAAGGADSMDASGLIDTLK